MARTVRPGASMRWLDLPCAPPARGLLAMLGALGAIAASGCTQPVGAPEPDPAIGRVSSPIAYGTLDSAHTAVVALLSPVGTTELQECTGSIVRVTGTEGVVLTAAHCCNTYPPTVVVASSSFAGGEPYASGGTPVAPSYRVVPSSVYYDALYAQNSHLDHDFCMLEFTGAAADLATLSTLALPSTGDGLSLGSQVQHVGYGVTDDAGANTNRRAGTDAVDQQLTPLFIQFSQGGAGHVPGTCDGDSGGPSLFPASSPQSGQVVVAVQSYGNAVSCAQITLGVGSRVSSAMSAGGFIASYLAGSPIGVQAGAASPASAGGAWAAALLGSLLVLAGLTRRPLRSRPPLPPRPAPVRSPRSSLRWRATSRTPRLRSTGPAL